MSGTREPIRLVRAPLLAGDDMALISDFRGHAADFRSGFITWVRQAREAGVRVCPFRRCLCPDCRRGVRRACRSEPSCL